MVKATIAKWLDRLYINQLLFKLSFFLYGPHIRIINYHGTPRQESGNFERQLQFFKEYYDDVAHRDLDDFFSSRLAKKRPGLIISFDDAQRNNIDFAVPLLEKYGFTGWFMIPAGLIESAYDQQSDFVKADKFVPEYEDGRYLMSWDEILKITERHVVGCHTFSHHRMSVDDSEETLEAEIVGSRRLMEQKLSRPIDIFCWVGGEKKSYTRAAANVVHNAGYRYGFMTNTYPVLPKTDPLQLQRTNIESKDPLFIVRFQLGLAMDWFYLFKRKRVEKLTAIRQ